MIKPQQFAGLALATAASVVAAALIFAMTNRWSQGRVEGASLVPGLARQEASIAAVEIVQGDKRITLQRGGEQWKIKERAGYPAATDRVRTLLNTIAKAELIEPKTAAKDRYAALELEDPAGKDAKSRGVRILDPKDKPLADIVIGKSRYDAFGSGRSGTYVRRVGDARTWLATGDPKASVELKDWVSTSVYEMEQGKIAKVTIAHPGEPPLIVEKGDGKEQKFKLDEASAKVPEGKKLKSNAADQIAQGFGSIDLEDVRKLDATPAGDKVSVITLQTEGGATVTFRLHKDGEANWLSLVATGADGDAKKKADEINARASGWEFKIPQWKADQIGKHHADLFETS